MAKRHRFLTGDDEHAVEVDRAPGGVAVTVDDGEPIAVELVEARAPGFVSWFAGGRQRRAYVARRGGAFEVTIGERRFLVQPASARRGRHVVGGAEDAPGRITAPSPASSSRCAPPSATCSRPARRCWCWRR